MILLACAQPDPVDRVGEPGTDGGCGEGEATWLVDELLFSREDPEGVSAGFDLDGRVSAEGDAAGCGLADFTDPDGTPGVDNQFAAILPALELTEAQAMEGIIDNAIHDGSLLLTLDLDHYDDPLDDACVDLSLGRATGSPMIAADGELEWYQTVELDSGQTPSEGAATVEAGVLGAEGLTVDIPLAVFDVSYDFTLDGAQLRFSVADDGSVSGWLGGGVARTQLDEVVATENIDDAVQELAQALIDENLDLGAECDTMSITFAFHAIPAFLYEEP